VSPQTTAPQPKAAPAPQGQSQAKAPPASKGPTPAPAIAPAPPPDEPSAASPSPAAKSASKGEQQAALPSPRPAPGAPKGAEQGIEILFTAGTSDLSSDAKAALDKLAENMKGNEKSRLQLLAYAYEEQASPSKSRRLSLSRALAVRSHLISKGIRSTRIDVRALGDQVPGGEPNRVDLKITDR
jgi:outer membrane protein OmpA-like peptidoglycan-associated protein